MRLEWGWSGDDEFPDSTLVTSSPTVIDLDGDGVPEVLFTSVGPEWNDAAVLRAVSGLDGHAVWSTVIPEDMSHCPPNYGCWDPDFDVAAGDIDADGRPDVISRGRDDRYYAFEADGQLKWRSPRLGVWINKAPPAIADVDHDGLAEIAVCETLLNSDGSVRWEYPRPSSSCQDMSLANLDLAGDMELVTGSGAISSDGTRLWQTDTRDALGPYTWYSGLADFDADGFPEIVTLGDGLTDSVLFLLEHDGRIALGPVRLPGMGWMALPAIADADGDGQPEIGIAGDYFYSVIESDGSAKWSTATGCKSTYHGTSAADLDGDGSAEFLYQGTCGVIIFRGMDGQVLWRKDFPEDFTSYWHTVPVVADVDADDRAELVLTGYGTAASVGLPSVRVYSHPTWMPTRRIWNQVSYHITNVLDDGSIPRHETNNWDVHNNYRVNAPLAGPPPTATPSPLTPRLVFPLLLRERPSPAKHRADVVLVVDASLSMSGTKLEAAKLAMRQFVAEMDLPRDRVAVIAFNRDAIVLQPLTGNDQSVAEALSAVSPGAGTRIDTGLKLALQELERASGGGGGEARAVVLLTDGHQESDRESPLTVARETREAGILTLAVGLGADVDADYMVQLVGDERRYYYAPGPDDLGSIYRAIARVIPCRPEDYWGRRCP